ncbi:MAG: hypothetical protein WDM76_09620 [Limisphaerales bacterium]
MHNQFVVPPTDPNQLTKRDRLLIGEFLRRHHPRLAQEIALFGVPTKGTNPLVLQGFSGETEHIAKLAGIVARSHGADVRTFLPHLERDFDIRQYKNVHAVFLMTVLRVRIIYKLMLNARPPNSANKTTCKSSITRRMESTSSNQRYS